jgi:hypothetical protein
LSHSLFSSAFVVIRLVIFNVIKDGERIVVVGGGAVSRHYSSIYYFMILIAVLGVWRLASGATRKIIDLEVIRLCAHHGTVEGALLKCWRDTRKLEACWLLRLRRTGLRKGQAEGDATIIVSTDMLPFTGVVKVLPVVCLTKQAELFISQSSKEAIARPLLYVNSTKVDDPSMVGVLVVLKD